MTDFISEFHDAMRAAGFSPKDGKVKADDKWHPAYYGDERGAKCTGAYTMKIVDGNFAIGCFFTRKDPDNKHKWHSNSGETLTSAQRRENKAKLEAYEKEKREEEARRHEKITQLLSRAYKSLPKTSKHEYLMRKGVKPHGIKTRKKGGELVIPLYAPDGRVSTIQRITKTGGKYLFTGGKKAGSYFPFATKEDDLSTILICEGFATAATVREATGFPCVAAIDSGNLKPVLEVLKKKYPRSRFIICADNDQFTFHESKRPKSIKPKEISGDDPRWQEWREAGLLWNVGIDKARQAAAANGGAHVIWPDFTDLPLSDKPTDYNDLAIMVAPDFVREQIMAAIEAIPAKGEAAEGLESSHDPDQQPFGGEFSHDPNYVPDPTSGMERIRIAQQGDFGLAFRCLGHHAGLNYYFSFKQRRIVSLSASQHTIQNLLQLDNLDNWYNSEFGNKGDITEKKLALYAQNAMNEKCTERGVFKEEDNVRGAGAWMDNGQIVVHCGDRLYVDGDMMGIEQMKSDYTYISAPKFMKPDSTVPLTNIEAIALRNICEAVTWENPLSGALLAGWLVIAPVCGALDYRPHIWITGEAESGKSTVINRIVRGVLGRMAISVEGGTTEAALRQAAGHDARPLVYDEAEPSQSMYGVIELARKATTGGVVGKHGQGQMRIRFAACFSSINPPVNKTADESRISFLVIKKNRKPSAIQDYEKLLKLMDDNLTPEFSNRLIARTIKYMDVLFTNIKTFQKAARRVIGGARASEQIGTMLAGLYLLHTEKPISMEAAEEFVRRYEWKDHTIIDEDTDPVRLVQHIAGAIIRYNAAGVNKDAPIGELIMLADGNNHEAAAIKMHGINRVGQRVFIANRSQNLSKLLRGTDWEMRWSTALLNIEGAEKHPVHYFSAGLRTSAVSLPLSLFASKDEQTKMDFRKPEPEEIPFDD